MPRRVIATPRRMLSPSHILGSMAKVLAALCKSLSQKRFTPLAGFKPALTSKGLRLEIFIR